MMSQGQRCHVMSQRQQCHMMSQKQGCHIMSQRQGCHVPKARCYVQKARMSCYVPKARMSYYVPMTRMWYYVPRARTSYYVPRESMSCPKGKDVIYVTTCHKGKDVPRILQARMSYYIPVARMSNEALETRNGLTSKSNMLTVLTPCRDQAIYQPSRQSIHKLTVCMSVDSALATKTKTSASKQNLSIHRSRSGDTSTPGLKHQHHVF